MVTLLRMHFFGESGEIPRDSVRAGIPSGCSNDPSIPGLTDFLQKGLKSENYELKIT